jgi:tRNA:m4X modification enzyme
LDLGFTAREFETMSRMSSWGTCGFRFDEKSFHLDKTEKEIVGRKCKRIIDWGRLEYLKNNGYKVSLVHYIPKEFSIENALLIARK